MVVLGCQLGPTRPPDHPAAEAAGGAAVTTQGVLLLGPLPSATPRGASRLSAGGWPPKPTKDASPVSDQLAQRPQGSPPVWFWRAESLNQNRRTQREVRMTQPEDVNYSQRPPISAEVWRDRDAKDWIVSPPILHIPTPGKDLVVARHRDGEIRAWLGGVPLSGPQDPELYGLIRSTAEGLKSTGTVDGLDPQPLIRAR